MNIYQKEQLESFQVIVDYLHRAKSAQITHLNHIITDYLNFRNEVETFLNIHVSDICSAKCFTNDLSACCSKDGIIVFFADLVVNALFVGMEKTAKTAQYLQTPHNGSKCLYLAEDGCKLSVRPIVCQMFLCTTAENQIFGQNQEAHLTWKALEKRRKDFTWPDKPVLFDQLEAVFIDSGYKTALMHCHNNPGLLRLKAGGIKKKKPI